VSHLIEQNGDKQARLLDDAQSGSHVQRVEAIEHKLSRLRCKCHRCPFVFSLVVSDYIQD
jgi:hypothetical protein